MKAIFTCVPWWFIGQVNKEKRACFVKQPKRKPKARMRSGHLERKQRREHQMADKAKRGTKRSCGGCGAKFYDLNREPAICPMCETVFEVKKPEQKQRRAPEKEQKPEKTRELEEEDIILEGDDDLIDIDEDDDTITPTEDDDTFLEVEDDDDNPVSGIIPGGGVSKNDDS